MCNILYISQLYHESLFDEYFSNSKAALDFASNNFSRAILKGFKENFVSVDVLNSPIIGSFPLYYKKLFVKGISSNGFESISFINLMYLKRLDIRRKMDKRILAWCEKNSANRILFFYSYSHLQVVEKVKSLYPDSKVFVLVADLPEYMPSSINLVTKISHLIGDDKPASGAYYNLVDGYVLLSAAMKDRFPVGNKPWTVVEGIYNPEEDDVKEDKEIHKTLLYTGDLGRRYGIVDLLKAFHGIDDPDYRLWICGNGDGRKDVEEFAKKDNRIIYKGILPRKEVIRLQKKATLLVNPRKSNQEYTKYSFPSKTIEYMASGTPTLMAHLQCIPSEYDKYLYYFNDESVSGMRDSIVKICNMPQSELKQKGENAALFINIEKTPKPQTRKILDLFNFVCDE